MSESKRTPRLEPDNVLSDDEVEDNVSTNFTPEDSKDTDTLLRRLKKALRLAGKLQSKVEFERQVSKELARRNEQLKKELETKDEVYIALKESFQEMFIQFDDLLVRYGKKKYC
jgi:glutamate synthase domain-containing protein 2